MKNTKIIIQIGSTIVVFLSCNILISTGTTYAREFGEKKRPFIEQRKLGEAKEAFEIEKERILIQAEEGKISFREAHELIIKIRKNILEKSRKDIYKQKLKNKIEIKLELKLEKISNYPQETQIKIYNLLLIKIKEKSQGSANKRAIIFDVIYEIILERKNNL